MAARVVVSYANTHADVTDHVGFGVDSPTDRDISPPFFFPSPLFKNFGHCSPYGGLLSVWLAGRLAWPPLSHGARAGRPVGSGEWVGGASGDSILERPCATSPRSQPGSPRSQPGAGKLRPGAGFYTPAPPASRTPGTGLSAQLSHRRHRRSEKCVVNGTWPGL